MATFTTFAVTGRYLNAVGITPDDAADHSLPESAVALAT